MARRAYRKRSDRPRGRRRGKGKSGLRIKLLVDLPVEKKHGCKAGMIFGAKRLEPTGRHSPLWEIKGSAGESVKVLSGEAEEIVELLTEG